MGFSHFFLYSDYEVQCICHEGSGCNLHDDPNLGDSIITAPNDAILAEVNKSIRHNIYFRTVNSLCTCCLFCFQFQLVYGSFGQINMHLISSQTN